MRGQVFTAVLEKVSEQPVLRAGLLGDEGGGGRGEVRDGGSMEWKKIVEYHNLHELCRESPPLTISFRLTPTPSIAFPNLSLL